MVYPVPSCTPSVSSLLQWDHSATYDVPAPDQDVTNSYKYRIDTSASGVYAYLQHHVIDGRALFPATGYVLLAWAAMAKSLRQHLISTPVTFKDVRLHRALLLPSDKCTFYIFVEYIRT